LTQELAAGSSAHVTSSLSTGALAAISAPFRRTLRPVCGDDRSVRPDHHSAGEFAEARQAQNLEDDLRDLAPIGPAGGAARLGRAWRDPHALRLDQTGE
jgi:hypothetical protein